MGLSLCRCLAGATVWGRGHSQSVRGSQGSNLVFSPSPVPSLLSAARILGPQTRAFLQSVTSGEMEVGDGDPQEGCGLPFVPCPPR